MVDAQAKQNKKLAKQQQDAAKKVAQLKAKNKPVPPELEQLAAGAAIAAANEQARNTVVNVRGQGNQNVESFEDGAMDTAQETDAVTVMEWAIHTLKTIIPIYNIIYLIQVVLGKKDVKESLK